MMINLEDFRAIVIGANNIYPGIFVQPPVENGVILNEVQIDHLYNEYVTRRNAVDAQINRIIVNKRCIKYFGIGEAPTQWETTYFYSPVAFIQWTPWFYVPLQHFSPNNPFFANRTVDTKTYAIEVLNDNGYHMEDVSPAPFIIKRIRRNTNRFRKLIKYLYCTYFLPHVVPEICILLCKDAKTILISTLSTDIILSEIINTGIPCNINCDIIVLKPAGICPGYPNPRTTLSSACATNGPISLLFTCAVA